MIRRFSATAVGLCLVLSACSTQPPVVREAHFSPAELLQESTFGPEVTPLAEVDLLAVNDDMRQFLREHVPPGASDFRKVQLILKGMLQDGLQISYHDFKTFTAQQAFYSREGNCLSFTNLFVALAREAGVDVKYQEVQVPPVWSARGDTWMFNQHINALVDLVKLQQVVDFALDAYDNDFDRRVISDREALSRYYNNMGVYALSEGDLGTAFANMREAIQLEPRTGYLWTNLGALYRRAGQEDAAESAYLRAVELDNDRAALSNLSRLYEALDQPELAKYYRERVDVFRARNPYYLFHLAEEAYAVNDFGEAQRLVNKALRINSADHEFHRLQGLSLLQLGQIGKAKKSFHKAAELAEGDAAAVYNRKLQLLAGVGEH